MCSCHSILECCIMFSGVKLSMESFVLLADSVHIRFYLDRYWLNIFVRFVKIYFPISILKISRENLELGTAISSILHFKSKLGRFH